MLGLPVDYYLRLFLPKESECRALLFKKISNRKKSLIVISGLLGDFDTFEYCQILRNKIPELTKLGFNIFIVAIGSNEAKNKFCRFCDFPKDKLLIVKNNFIHNELGLYEGLKFHGNNWINMLLMCAGIASKGTIPEVLRGYTGDCKSINIYNKNDLIHLTSYCRLKGSLFKVLGKEGSLRPFELATRRLENMIEIVKNRNLYLGDRKYLTQRGGTFIIDENLEILYKYSSKGLLCYSETMSDPLNYLKYYIK